MEQVTVSCNRCGTAHCFFPQTVSCMRACSCGNDNWGIPSKWKENNFGNFTLVQRADVNLEGLLPIPKLEWW